MAKKTPEERIAELEKRRIQVEAKLKAEKEAILRAKRRENAKIQNQKRKDDTRRKVLVGAAILQKIELNQWPEEKLMNLMDGFLTRDKDRKLFRLESKRQ
ncbi:MAG: mobilization protein C [Marinobacter sp.]|jgi:hypothetical protein|nr:mobilization protein C [Marinobacter sp.]